MTDQINLNDIKDSSKKPSALALLLAAPKTKVNETDKKAAVAAFKASQGERDKLQAALDAHDAKANATAVALVKCFGAQHLMIGGVRFVPTSRGDRIYYKKMGDQSDVVEL